MSPSLAHRPLCSPAALSANEVHALLGTAAALKPTARLEWQPLRGRHLALLCGNSEPACSAFARAMAEAGASVALLHAGTWHDPAGDEWAKAARLLGKLYDAIDCCGLAPPLVEQLARHAGVPVFDGIALMQHPTRLLADLLTMREASRRPLDRLRVRLRGDAGSALYHEAEALLGQAGVGLRESPAPLGVAATGTDPNHDDEDADFVLDVEALPARGRLVVPGASAVEQERIDRLLLDNRHVVQQALVVSVLN